MTKYKLLVIDEMNIDTLLKSTCGYDFWFS